MATPVGHALAGVAIGLALRGGRASLALAVGGAAAALSPDLDFVPGLLAGDPSRFHHALTHSLGAAMMVAALAALIARHERGRWSLVVGTAYLSHLLLDYLTVDDSPPNGIPALWPLGDAVFLSPIALLPPVLHSDGNAISLHNVLVALRELALLGPLVLFAGLWRRRRDVAMDARREATS